MGSATVSHLKIRGCRLQVVLSYHVQRSRGLYPWARILDGSSHAYYSRIQLEFENIFDEFHDG